jgi:O-antigen/teichoic acid export membrane protein
MSVRIRTLGRRLLHAGAAGDAAAAGGRQIASNIAIQLSARVISMATSVVTVSLTARTLDPGGYGVLNGMTAYVGLFSVFTDLGFTATAMQKMASEPERESEWLGALAGARTGLSLLTTLICAISIPLLLSNTHHGHVVGLILTVTILMTGPQTLMAVFQSRLRSGIALSFGVLQSFLWLGIVITLAIAHASVIDFAAANVLLLIFMGIFQVLATHRLVPIAWRAGLHLWTPLLRIAVPMGVASIFIAVYYQVDSVLLLQIAGAHEAGIYSAAYGFLGPLLFVPGTIMSSFFPVLSAVYKSDPERARRLVQICLDLMAAVSLPVLAGTLALSDKIVHLLYGAGFERSGGVLPILMIAFVSICFGSLAGFLSPILNLQWRLALYSGIGALGNVILNLVLIPPYGAHGSAWATVATEILTMTLMLSTALRALRLRISPWKLLRTLALAAVMCGSIFLARPLGLLPAGLIGVLLYLTGLFATRIVDLAELRSLRRQVSIATKE